MSKICTLINWRKFKTKYVYITVLISCFFAFENNGQKCTRLFRTTKFEITLTKHGQKNFCKIISRWKFLEQRYNLQFWFNILIDRWTGSTKKLVKNV